MVFIRYDGGSSRRMTINLSSSGSIRWESMAAVSTAEEGGSHSNLSGTVDGKKMTWSDAFWMNHICDIWSIKRFSHMVWWLATPPHWLLNNNTWIGGEKFKIVEAERDIHFLEHLERMAAYCTLRVGCFISMRKFCHVWHGWVLHPCGLFEGQL